MECKIIILRKFCILSITLLFACACYAELPTPASIISFYKGMDRLSRATDDNSAAYICKEMKECFAIDIKEYPSGLMIPNDFRLFKHDEKKPSHRDGSLTSSNYVNRLDNYLYEEKSLKVSYYIGKSVVDASIPDFNKSLCSSNYLVATYVKKTFTLDGEIFTFNDTVLTTYKDGRICEISNGGGFADINIPALRIKAGRYYHHKDYHNAYECYKKILDFKTDDADALYRIALMTYYQQGCYFGKKEAHKRGRRYMKLAESTGNYEIAGKASQVLFHWDYPRL